MATDEAGGLRSVLDGERSTLLWKNFPKNPTVPRLKSIPVPPSATTIRLPAVTIACCLVLVLVWLPEVLRWWWH